jgi:hypothetical protein
VLFKKFKTISLVPGSKKSPLALLPFFRNMNKFISWIAKKNVSTVPIANYG